MLLDSKLREQRKKLGRVRGEHAHGVRQVVYHW
jgi:hypothetical protein